MTQTTTLRSVDAGHGDRVDRSLLNPMRVAPQALGGQTSSRIRAAAPEPSSESSSWNNPQRFLGRDAALCRASVS